MFTRVTDHAMEVDDDFGLNKRMGVDGKRSAMNPESFDEYRDNFDNGGDVDPYDIVSPEKGHAAGAVLLSQDRVRKLRMKRRVCGAILTSHSLDSRRHP